MISWRFFNLKKVFTIVVLVIVFLTIKMLDRVTNTLEEGKANNKEPEEVETRTPVVERNFSKIFHLDLKGSPPKLSYLTQILSLVKRAGANGILIEYEDMFPFSGFLKNVSAKNAYTKKEIKSFIEFAESMDMEVIPLVQTFGHLEYVLKLQEFQHLRELETFPEEICPSKKEAVGLVKELIKQVMALHGNSKFVHLGCDEVRHLGSCSRCSRENSKKIFSSHVREVASFVAAHFPGVTPLIWDDMLRTWTFVDLAKFDLGGVVQPVVWVYVKNIVHLLPGFLPHLYQRIFSKFWVSSAFKGAFGETEVLPDLKRHLENNLAWMKILTGKQQGFKFDTKAVLGIFVTGWSRYDHFAVLCELLPVGLPSLILSLVFLQHRFQDDHQEGLTEWMKLLRCPEELRTADIRTIENSEFFRYRLGSCSFPGSDLYDEMSKYHILKSRIKEMLSKIDANGWVTNYNIEKNFTSPWRIIEMFPQEGFAGEVLRKKMVTWKKSFLPIIRQYFDEHTVSEWTEQNIWPVENKLKNIQEIFQKLLLRKTWPQRPLS